jgi:DNA-binding NarL/FixJ family response regulator
VDFGLDNVRVLIVEDETLLALDLEMTLAANGCTVVGPSGTIGSAVASIDALAPDAAILDLNLNGESSVAVADTLADRGVPFLFLTGYDREHLPQRHRSAPSPTSSRNSSTPSRRR